MTKFLNYVCKRYQPFVGKRSTTYLYSCIIGAMVDNDQLTLNKCSWKFHCDVIIGVEDQNDATFHLNMMTCITQIWVFLGVKRPLVHAMYQTRYKCQTINLHYVSSANQHCILFMQILLNCGSCLNDGMRYLLEYALLTPNSIEMYPHVWRSCPLFFMRPNSQILCKF